MRSLKRAATIANRRERPNGRARRTLGARPAISVRKRRKEMPELVALRAQVLPVGFVGWDLGRHALGDVQAVVLQSDDLLRVVGEQPDVLHSQIYECLGADYVFAHIGFVAGRYIGLARV